MQYQEDKFINALLYFGKNTDPQYFGITKLLKLLFISDFKHFEKYARPILGDFYVRIQLGPIPSISYNLFNSETPELEKVMRIINEKKGDFDFKRIEALEDPNLDVFSESDLEIMQTVAKKYFDFPATKMVKQIHEIDFIKDLNQGDRINYDVVLTKAADKEYAQVLQCEEDKFECALI